MKMTARDFKAKCLAVIDRVQSRREPVVVTKRGWVKVRPVPDDATDDRPWLRLRQQGILPTV
jgi:prevent-host-death family protein